MTTIKAADYRTEVLKAMTEKEWLAQVTTYAQHRGWAAYHTWRSIHSAAGFPDLCMVRAMPNGDRRIVFAELKTMKGRISIPQRDWLEALTQVAELCRGHVEVHCWTPAHWPQVKERLM